MDGRDSIRTSGYFDEIDRILQFRNLSPDEARKQLKAFAAGSQLAVTEPEQRDKHRRRRAPGKTKRGLHE